MVTQLVDVAALRFRFFLRDLVLVEVILFDIVVVDLLLEVLESKLSHVDVVQGPQLLLEFFEVPLRQLAGLVVSQPEGLHLLLGQIVRNYDRNFLQTEFDCRLKPCMACNYDPVFVNDDRVLEVELLDARGDRVDCLVIVSRVVFVRSQLSDVSVDYLLSVHSQ